MNWAYIVFLLCSGLNGVLLGMHDVNVLSLKYIVWVSIPIVTWLCGRFYKEG